MGGVRPSYQFPFSLILSSAQSITIYISFELDWPTWIVRMSGVAKGLVFLNPVQMSAPECSMKLSYDARVYLQCITPWLILIIFFAAKIYITASARRSFQDSHAEEFEKSHGRESFHRMSIADLQAHHLHTCARFKAEYREVKRDIKQKKLEWGHQVRS